MKSYIMEEVKLDAMYITLNKIFFNNELEHYPIFLIPCDKEVSADVFNDVIFVNYKTELKDHEQFGYLLFEMCQIKAFKSGSKDRLTITYNLADQLDRCGYYTQNGDVIIKDRFIKESSEYEEIKDLFINTLNDIKKSLEDLSI